MVGLLACSRHFRGYFPEWRRGFAVPFAKIRGFYRLSVILAVNLAGYA
jgi:hypothetical protein